MLFLWQYINQDLIQLLKSTKRLPTGVGSGPNGTYFLSEFASLQLQDVYEKNF